MYTHMFCHGLDLAGSYHGAVALDSWIVLAVACLSAPRRRHLSGRPKSSSRRLELQPKIRCGAASKQSLSDHFYSVVLMTTLGAGLQVLHLW
jgi:hypothetical protein